MVSPASAHPNTQHPASISPRHHLCSEQRSPHHRSRKAPLIHVLLPTQHTNATYSISPTNAWPICRRRSTDDSARSPVQGWIQASYTSSVKGSSSGCARIAKSCRCSSESGEHSALWASSRDGRAAGSEGMGHREGSEPCAISATPGFLHCPLRSHATSTAACRERKSVRKDERAREGEDKGGCA
jgi:hypothetical protein